jgi:hypothetical protein
MGDTVDALAYKTDVKTRVKESIPDGHEVKEGARQVVGVAQENPLGLALGGLAAGFLVGMIIPSTKIEDEKVGPVADQVQETAVETGQEALDRGREVASQVAEQAVEGAKQVGQEAVQTAKEAGQEQAEELKDSAAENAQEVKQQARA